MSTRKVVERKNIDVYFDSGVRGWIISKAIQEHWRMAPWYELRDLIQDGYVCYLKCRNKYTLGPPEPGHQDLCTDTPNDKQRRHLMDLTKTAFSNHIMTLSSRFAAGYEQPEADLGLDDEYQALERLLPSQPEQASILAVLSNAPAELLETANRVLRDGLDEAECIRSKLRRHDGRVQRGRRALRETNSEFWQRVAGDAVFPQTLTSFLISDVHDVGTLLDLFCEQLSSYVPVAPPVQELALVEA